MLTAPAAGCCISPVERQPVWGRDVAARFGRDPVSNTLTAQESSWHVSAEDTTMGTTAPSHRATLLECAAFLAAAAPTDSEGAKRISTRLPLLPREALR